MTTASDDFNRSENPLSTGWTKASGTADQLKANGTAAIGVAGVGDQCSLWTGNTFADDQYSEAVLSVDGSDDIGVCVRGSTSASQFYLYDIQGGTSGVDGIYKYGGSYVVMGAKFGAGTTAAHTYRIEATGGGTTTLTVKDNGSTVTTRTDSTSPFTSGRPGIYVANGTMSWNWWNGGDLSGGAPPAQTASPISDAADGQWLASDGSGNLYSMVDEAAFDDSDFMYTNTLGLCSLNIGTTIDDPGVDTGHAINYRAKGDGVKTLEATLWQGSYSIAVFSTPAASINYTTYVSSLTETQASSITNYDALRLDFRFF